MQSLLGCMKILQGETEKTDLVSDLIKNKESPSVWIDLQISLHRQSLTLGRHLEGLGRISVLQHVVRNSEKVPTV